jgi:NAD(P)-dependent dehydrogenase (short-subunit alcohol dehydrogenase family)
MAQRFEGKIAVITGGNSGIGLATARAFVAEGAKVVITGRSVATLKAAQDELGSAVLAIRTDVSRVAEITRAMEQIRASFGRIDALFVNAGIAKFVAVDDVTEEMFDETMSTNLKGAYFTVQKAIPLLSNGAAVVLNASISAHVGMPNTSVYAASKAGVLNLAKTLSAPICSHAACG